MVCARQAKGRAQNAAKRSGGQAARPVVAARASGPGGARLEDVEKLVRRRRTVSRRVRSGRQEATRTRPRAATQERRIRVGGSAGVRATQERARRCVGYT